MTIVAENMSNSSSFESPSQQSSSVKTEAAYRGHSFVDTTIESTHFLRGDFQQIQANNSKFLHNTFEHCLFHAATIRQANWSHCKFMDCVGTSTELEEVNLQHTIMQRCGFEQSSFYAVDWSHAQIEHVNFNQTDLRYSSFAHAKLHHVNFNNCDLANCDFTNVQFESIHVYNARITNVRGLTEEQKNWMLANGAYEGLAPSLNKFRKRAENASLTIQHQWQKLQNLPVGEWIQHGTEIPKKWQKWVEETYTEWQEEREKQRKQQEEQEALWKQEQEERRLQNIALREEREDRRKQEKLLRKQAQELQQQRRQKEQEVQRNISEQQKDRQQLQQTMVEFFQTIRSQAQAPLEIQQAKDNATALYQETEKALSREKEFRALLSKSPLDTNLQANLQTQVSITQELAEKALDAQEVYYSQYKNWQTQQDRLIQELQRQSIQQGEQQFLEWKTEVEKALQQTSTKITEMDTEPLENETRLKNDTQLIDQTEDTPQHTESNNQIASWIEIQRALIATQQEIFLTQKEEDLSSYSTDIPIYIETDDAPLGTPEEPPLIVAKDISLFQSQITQKLEQIKNNTHLDPAMTEELYQTQQQLVQDILQEIEADVEQTESTWNTDVFKDFQQKFLQNITLEFEEAIAKREKEEAEAKKRQQVQQEKLAREIQEKEEIARLQQEKIEQEQRRIQQEKEEKRRQALEAERRTKEAREEELRRRQEILAQKQEEQRQKAEKEKQQREERQKQLEEEKRSKQEERKRQQIEEQEKLKRLEEEREAELQQKRQEKEEQERKKAEQRKKEHQQELQRIIEERYQTHKEREDARQPTVDTLPEAFETPQPESPIRNHPTEEIVEPENIVDIVDVEETSSVDQEIFEKQLQLLQLQFTDRLLVEIESTPMDIPVNSPTIDTIGIEEPAVTTDTEEMVNTQPEELLEAMDVDEARLTQESFVQSVLQMEQNERTKKELEEAKQRKYELEQRLQQEKTQEEQIALEKLKLDLREKASIAKKEAQALAEEKRRQAQLEKETQRALLQAQKEKERQTRLAEIEQKRADAVLRKREEEQRKAQALQEAQIEQERLQQYREILRLEQEKLEQAKAFEREKQRKQEYLASLKNRLLEEANRQEYQELEEKLERELQEDTARQEQLEKKQQAYLEQLRLDNERRKHDPLLQEEQRQRELAERRQERLQRLQEREQELQQKLEELQRNFDQASDTQQTIQLHKPLQQGWYRFTDAMSMYAPGLAGQLDKVKEQIEELYIAQQASARYAREQQKELAQRAMEEKLQLEHEQRLSRLAYIRAKEEEREEKLQQEIRAQTKRAAIRQEKERIVSMHVIERHEWRRIEYQNHSSTPENFENSDLRIGDYTAVTWHRSNLHSAILSGARLEYAGLMGSNLSLVYLDYARLSASTLDYANLEKANLEGAILFQASARHTNFRLARLYDSDMREMDLLHAELFGVDCTGSIANNSIFDFAQAQKTIFAETDLRHASFVGTDLSEANFHRANLENAVFTDAILTQANFKGCFGLSKQQLLDLANQGAIIDIGDASDKYTSFGAPQLRVAIALFTIGLGSLLVNVYMNNQQTDTASLEKEAQELRESNLELASIRYEELAEKSQILGEQVQFYIEAATIAEQHGDNTRARTLFNKAMASADLDSELNAKVGLRFAQFYLSHTEPSQALELLRNLVRNQSLTTFQRSRLIIYMEQACAILHLDAQEELQVLYTNIAKFPEVEADVFMALSDMRLQYGQTEKAMLDLQHAEQIPMSEGLALRLLESKARLQDRMGNLGEAIAQYESIRQQTAIESSLYQSTSLTLADLYRRNGEIPRAMEVLESLLQTPDGRVQSRVLLIQARINEEQQNFETAANIYQQLLSIENGEPETIEEARVSLARLVLQGNSTLLDDVPPEIVLQAKIGQARSLLDQGKAEEAMELYKTILQDVNTLQESMRRAAQSGLAEGYSEIGKHQEANTIWESLLRENLDPMEAQHIEILLSYSKLQANDIAGAKLSFTSLQNSTDQHTRTQAALGLAQVSVRSGELERAKEIYQSLLQTNNSFVVNEDIVVQVWQELAEIAKAQDSISDQLFAWKNIIQHSGEDEALRNEAHTSIAQILAQMNQLEDAVSECEMNLHSAEALLQCAMIMEMAKDPRALERYTMIVENEKASDSIRSEAGLGAARLETNSNKRYQIVLDTLALSTIDTIVELQLLEFGLTYDTVPTETRTKWETRREQLLQSSSTLLQQYALEKSTQLRNNGQKAEAIAELTKYSQQLSSTAKYSLEMELADILVETGEYTKAESLYQALANTETEFSIDAKIGLVDCLRYQEKWNDAVSILETFDIEQVTEREQHSLLAINQEHPSTQGQTLAEKWASASSNPDVQWEGLWNQANQAFAEDQYSTALSLYEKAYTVAIEERQKGWALLGKAQTLSMTDAPVETVETIYTDVFTNPDTEVALQAHIQLAQYYATQERFADGLATLDGVDGSTLGAGWDSSVEDIRVRLCLQSQEYDKAAQYIAAIQQRWPNEEQVQIPAAMLLAQLQQQQGNIDTAQQTTQTALQQTNDPVYRDMLASLLQELQQ